MPGGLLNIAAYGAENVILTGNPKKTTLDDMRLMYQYSIEGKLFN